jgi:hypothetical protein
MTAVTNEIPFRMVSSFPSGLTVTLNRFKSNAYAMICGRRKISAALSNCAPENGRLGRDGWIGKWVWWWLRWVRFGNRAGPRVRPVKKVAAC